MHNIIFCIHNLNTIDSHFYILLNLKNICKDIIIYILLLLLLDTFFLILNYFRLFGFCI